MNRAESAIYFSPWQRHGDNGNAMGINNGNAMGIMATPIWVKDLAQRGAIFGSKKYVFVKKYYLCEPKK